MVVVESFVWVGGWYWYYGGGGGVGGRCLQGNSRA